jgi:hypothetical protein
MSTRRGARSHVANFSTVVLALKNQTSGNWLLGSVSFNISHTGGNVVDDPMREAARLGSIGISHGQNERFCLRWSIPTGKALEGCRHPHR